MADSKPQKPDPRAKLACLECGYDLRSLPRNGSCPECGTSIRLSRKYRSEILSAIHQLPGLPLIMLFLCIATLTGAPALLVYCAQELLLYDEARGGSLARLLIGATPWLLLIGSITPILTVAAMRKSLTRRDIGNRLVLLLILLGCVGWGLMIWSGPLARGSALFAIGGTLSALGCAVGLGTMSGVIGGAIPQWERMGSARQSVAPLVWAILLVGLLRVVILGLPPGWVQLLWTLRGALIGTEALLAIGTGYLLINRLWLANSLNQARRMARVRSSSS